MVYQLRETSGHACTFNPLALLKLQGTGTAARMLKKATQLNVLGEEIKPVSEDFSIAAFETVFIKLAWNEQ